MSHRFFRLLVVIMIMIGMVAVESTPSVQAAGPWYVLNAGDDNNDCLTPNSACATISAAIDKADPGDEVKVASGTYIGFGNVGISIAKSITLSGGWDSTFTIQSGLSTIDGQGTPGVSGISTSHFADPNIAVSIDRFLITHTDIAISNGVRTALTVSNSTITGNEQIGIWAIGGPGATILSSYITNNRGAGINISGDSLIVNDSMISDNGQTGIAYTGGFSPAMNIQNSAITGNRGGGVDILGSGFAQTQVNIENSTVANNSTSSFATGGGIMLRDSFPINLTINNSTIAANSSTSGGGIYNSSAANTVTLSNTILANNNASGLSADCFGTIQTSHHNIIGNTADCAISAGPGDQFDADPLLSAYLVGTEYFTLQSNSPAIDAGDPGTCAARDQRGMLRTQGSACDMGAYEFVASPGPAALFGLASGLQQRVTPGTTAPIPFAAYAIDANGSAVPGVDFTFTAPDTGASGTFLDTGNHVSVIATDSTGLSIAPPFTANNIAGEYQVVATAPEMDGSILFNVLNAAWYVSTTGDDSNSCTIATEPCRNISTAVSRALDGETIFVAGGTYTDPNGAIFISKDVSLIGGWDESFAHRSAPSIIDGQEIHNGIFVDQATVTLDGFHIRNGFGCSGSGILNFGSLTLLNSSLYDNRTDPVCGAGGGAIWTFGSLNAQNVTVSGNHSHHGGGIHVSGGSVELVNVTISNNRSPNEGGGIYVSSGTVTIQNSIIASNTADFNVGPDCAGVISASDHNIIADTNGCSITPGPGDQFNVDPELGPFLPALGFHPLMSTSPAVDAGDDETCAETDQRGVTRPQGNACDMGAYEFATPGAASSLLTVSGDNQRTSLNTAFPEALQAAVLDEHGNLVPGVSVDFTAPANGPSGTFENTGTHTTSVVTGAGGIASASVFTANNEAGSYQVIASASGLGTVQFNLEQVDRPANDNFGNATTIFTLPFTDSINTLQATLEPNEPSGCNFMEQTVWYRFTPESSMRIHADTLGGVNANLHIYHAFGPDITHLGLIACAGAAGSVDIQVQAEQTYYIQAGPASGESGTIQVNVSKPPSLSGRVVDAASSAPLPSAFVTLYRECGLGCLEFMAFQSTDGNGQFVFDNRFGAPLPDGSYQIEVSRSLYVTQQFGPFAFESADLDVGDLPLAPLPLIGSIRGRLIDPVTNSPVSAAFAPIVSLYRCDQFGCNEFMNSANPDAAGNFRFETDMNGNPLPVGTYQVAGDAEQYQLMQTESFSVGEGEDYDLGVLHLMSAPVRFTDTQVCDTIPASGGTCEFNVRITNGTNATLTGAAWTVVDGTLPNTFIGFTSFQPKEAQSLDLARGGSRLFRFRFNIPASNSPEGTYFCINLYVGQGNNPTFNTVGIWNITCVFREGTGFSLLSADDARARLHATATSTVSETEPNNSCFIAQDMGEVSDMVVVDGNLDSSIAPDVDFFRFTGTPGQLVSVDLEGQSTGNGTLGDPYLGFFDSNCNLLASNDDSGSFNSHLDITVPGDGIYILGATRCCDSAFSGGGNGTYQMTVAPVDFPVSIRGQVVDAVTGQPLRGDADPFTFVRLLQCSWFGCFDVNSQNTDSDGRFFFETDGFGTPLGAGEYIIVAFAEQYQVMQTEIFNVGEEEDHDLGTVPLSSYPVRFSNVVTCSVSSDGDMCEFSIRVTNGLSTRLSGRAWSMVIGFDLGSFANFTLFQTGDPLSISLEPGRSATLRFRFRVRGSVADGAFMCPTIFVGQNPDSYYNTVGHVNPFCITKGDNGFTVLSPAQTQAILHQIELRRFPPPEAVLEKRK